MGLRMGSTFWAVDLARVGAATMALAAERELLKPALSPPIHFSWRFAGWREFSSLLLQVVDPVQKSVLQVFISEM